MMLSPHPTTAPDACTFRHFVTGPCNALAYNAALTVAREPGRAISPLYLSGPAGCGKTHLLRAIAAYLTPRLRPAEVIVVSAAAFAAQFAQHRERGTLATFRRRYRHAAALLLDDVAALSGRDDAAVELLQTLDALRETGRQVVIADRKSPLALRALPARLCARLGSGFCAELATPDAATRLAILRHKTACAGCHVCGYSTVSEEALAVLASRMRGSARDLEDALVRLERAASATGAPATAALALQIAHETQRGVREGDQARIAAVLAAVCAEYDVTPGLLRDSIRTTHVAQARHVAMYLLREELGLSAAQAGQALGRDHSTVLHGHGRIAQALAAGDGPLHATLERLRVVLARSPHTA